MHSGSFFLRLATAALLVAAMPARAQFYDLDGAYHCVTKSDSACLGGVNVTPGPPSPPPLATSHAPTLDSAIADIRAQKPSEADMRLLESHAAQKEPRAVEALAWCKLNGLGTPADPLAAYFLYGDAARLGVPHAQANQIAIFETRLTQQQRQDVLMKVQTN